MRSVLGVHWRDWCWSWNSNTLATWFKELTHLKRPQCWERLRAGGEGDNRGWDSWMASPTQWTWVWVNSGSWWWTGRPGVLQFMGLQRVGHDWATELNLKKLEPETACTQPSDSLDNGIILTHCFKHQNTGWCNMFISKLFFKEWTLNHLYFKIFSKNNTQH